MKSTAINATFSVHSIPPCEPGTTAFPGEGPFVSWWIGRVHRNPNPDRPCDFLLNCICGVPDGNPIGDGEIVSGIHFSDWVVIREVFTRLGAFRPGIVYREHRPEYLLVGCQELEVCLRADRGTAVRIQAGGRRTAHEEWIDLSSYGIRLPSEAHGSWAFEFKANPPGSHPDVLIPCFEIFRYGFSGSLAFLNLLITVGWTLDGDQLHFSEFHKPDETSIEDEGNTLHITLAPGLTRQDAKLVARLVYQAEYRSAALKVWKSLPGEHARPDGLDGHLLCPFPFAGDVQTQLCGVQLPGGPFLALEIASADAQAPFEIIHGKLANDNTPGEELADDPLPYPDRRPRGGTKGPLGNPIDNPGPWEPVPVPTILQRTALDADVIVLPPIKDVQRYRREIRNFDAEPVGAEGAFAAERGARGGLHRLQPSDNLPRKDAQNRLGLFQRVVGELTKLLPPEKYNVTVLPDASYPAKERIFGYSNRAKNWVCQRNESRRYTACDIRTKGKDVRVVLVELEHRGSDKFCLGCITYSNDMEYNEFPLPMLMDRLAHWRGAWIKMSLGPLRISAIHHTPWKPEEKYPAKMARNVYRKLTRILELPPLPPKKMDKDPDTSVTVTDPSGP